jgi:hypothetical protein
VASVVFGPGLRPLGAEGSPDAHQPLAATDRGPAIDVGAGLVPRAAGRLVGQEHLEVGALTLAVLDIPLLLAEAGGEAALVAAFGAFKVTYRAADEITEIADRLFTGATGCGRSPGAAAVRREAPPVTALALAGTTLVQRDA